MKHQIYVGALAMLVAVVGCGKSSPYRDEKKNQEINCINNLKQISLGLRIWSGDHRDKNPFEVSTNAGGVLELVAPKDGFRQNGYLIFQSMSNELTIPLILICPKDRAKHPAANWGTLSESNVTYLFPASSNVLVFCPIDGNVLYADGSIVEKSTSKHWP